MVTVPLLRWPQNPREQIRQQKIRLNVKKSQLQMNQYGGVFTRILNGREFDQLYNFLYNFYKFLNAYYCVVIAIKFRDYSQCLELGYGVTDLWGHMAISSHRMVVPSISTVFPNCLYYFRICLLQLFTEKRWLFVCQLFELLVVWNVFLVFCTLLLITRILMIHFDWLRGIFILCICLSIHLRAY